MVPYLIKRLLLIIPTLVGITVVTFAVIKLAPSDPAELKAQAASEALADNRQAAKIVEETRRLYNLNEPLHTQYISWLKRAVRMDFGTSLKDGRRVWDKIKEALPLTLTLNILSVFITYIISIPLGAWCALKPASVRDRLTSLVLFLLYSLPSFWIAMILISLVSSGDYLNIFPVAGFVSDNAEELNFAGFVLNVLWHLAIPVLCLTAGSFAFMSRFARAAFLEVLRENYVTTARAKGLSEFKVMWKHVLRNALTPFITLITALLPALLAGSVIVEEIFAIPGMGRLGFESVLARDYPVVMAITFVSAFVTLASVLIADIMYSLADPRIRMT